MLKLLDKTVALLDFSRHFQDHLLEDFDIVREGAGLMMIGGYHSFGPGGYRETPLADVLPVEIGPAQRL